MLSAVTKSFQKSNLAEEIKSLREELNEVKEKIVGLQNNLLLQSQELAAIRQKFSSFSQSSDKKIVPPISSLFDFSSPPLSRNYSSPPPYRETTTSGLVQLVQFIKIRLDAHGIELLDDFLSTQELLATANDRNRKVLQRTYELARVELVTVISEKEVSALETAYQAENNQLIAQVEQRVSY